MQNLVRGSLVGVLLVACAACGVSDVVVPAEQPTAPASVSAVPQLSPEGELVDSQPTLPTEAAYGFADIATSTADAGRAWARFGLQGEPPSVTEGTALLFRGLGESSGCSTDFLGLQVTADQVRLTTGDGEQAVAASRACRADYRPRTLVVAVPLDALPQGAFSLDGFPLASAALTAPPSTETVDPWTSADPSVTVASEPGTVSVGGQVQVIATTGRLAAWPGSWATRIERWEGQRWLPAPGADSNMDHPAAEPAHDKVPAGSTGAIAVIDATELPPGDYRVMTQLGLGDSEGSTGAQARFAVTG